MADIRFRFEGDSRMFELGRLFFVNNPRGTPRKLGNNITRISRVHCRFVWDAEAFVFVLEDVAANGTWLNGKKIGKGKRVYLEPGDKIVLLFDNEEKVPLLEYEFIPLYEQDGKEIEMEREPTAATQLLESQDDEGGSDDKDSTPVRRKRERDAKEEDEEQVDEEEEDEEEESQQDEQLEVNAKRHKPWLETAAGRAAQVGVFAVGAYMVFGMLGMQ